MSRKGVIVLTILLSLFILVGCSKDPLDTYRESAIEVLEDYRVAKIDRKEAYTKLQTIASRVSGTGENLDERINASTLSTTINSIVSKLILSYSEPSAKDIDNWIQEIKSTKK